AHCFAGKDRTGFTVATVLETVGVDRDRIIADFLASNGAIPAGHDMQRGPPRPVPSSEASMDSTSMPESASRALVSELRS
ncbi:tyrosine-protein phosphatase, partial [Mycolicibacterium porcinum]|uniref:tyrosine-protein phosphatase n=1 Tax=Mycolicibacterium porcinum TaxID=39693 RepID=UPI00256EF517